MIEATCRGCGCTESNACAGGCSWIELDELTGAGLCSVCASEPELFDVCAACLELLYVPRDSWIFIEDGGRLRLDVVACSLEHIELWQHHTRAHGWPLHIVDGQLEEHTT